MSGINGKNALQSYRANIGNFDGGKVNREMVEQRALAKAIARSGCRMSNSSHEQPLTGKQLMIGMLAVGTIGLALGATGASAAPTGGISNRAHDQNYGGYNKLHHRNAMECLHTQVGSRWYWFQYYDTCKTRNHCDFDVSTEYKIKEGASHVTHIRASGEAECPRDYNNLKVALKEVISATPGFGREDRFAVQDWQNSKVVATSEENVNILLSYFKTDEKTNVNAAQDLTKHFVAVSVNAPDSATVIEKAEYNKDQKKWVLTLGSLEGMDIRGGVHLVSKRFYDSSQA